MAIKNKTIKRKYIPIIITLFLGLIIFTAATVVDKNSRQYNLVKNLEIFGNLFKEVNTFYVDNTDPEELVEDAMKSMLKSLDPYTVYLPESEMDNFKTQTTGKYAGIGSLIRKAPDYVILSQVYKGTPADKAGLRSGDHVVKINGKAVKNMGVKDVSENLKGDPQTEVTVTVNRLGVGDNEDVKITRQIVSIPAVPYYGMLDDNTGYIRLSNFTKRCAIEVKDALIDLKTNSGATKLVLDLRGNPGGIITEAVDIVNIFVPKNTLVVSTKGKIKAMDNQYKTRFDPVDKEIPIVVLTSRGSASASEIVSGALQDLDRAVIIGERTFGKGLVQMTRPVGYNAYLKVTTAKYYIPSGRCIQALDYTNRNEDGSVGHIPDSLITEFKTKEGRSVYDGGGVTPDITVESEKYSNITFSLYTKYHFFDFATQFMRTHETIPPVSQFSITDEIFNDFKTFIADKNYDYITKSEAKLKELEDIAKKEKYYDISKTHFTELKKQLGHDKQKDLKTFEGEIKDLLREEICGRYYYSEGMIKTSLRGDKQLEKAKSIINSTADYNAVLSKKGLQKKSKK